MIFIDKFVKLIRNLKEKENIGRTCRDSRGDFCTSCCLLCLWNPWGCTTKYEFNIHIYVK